MPSRRKTREFVLQVLYAADVQKKDPEELFTLFERNFDSDEDSDVKMERVVKEFARELIDEVSENLSRIDETIGDLSHHWKVSRMNLVDRNIIRLAIAEMARFPEIPRAVTLNEAIDLGKKYGTDNSPTFINGILDKITEESLMRHAPKPEEETD
ncbi:MAG: transcription antitermination factor NusB [Pseudomonadota bacterium]